MRTGQGSYTYDTIGALLCNGDDCVELYTQHLLDPLWGSIRNGDAQALAPTIEARPAIALELMAACKARSVERGVNAVVGPHQDRAGLMKLLLAAIPNSDFLLVDAGLARQPDFLSDFDGEIPLMAYAAMIAKPDMLKSLIAHGRVDGMNLLAHPSQRGQTPIFRAIALQRMENLFLLLDEGASVNVQDNEGKSPLHFLFHMDTPEIGKEVNKNVKAIARALIDHGADTALTDEKGLTALDMARECTDEHRVGLDVWLEEIMARGCARNLTMNTRQAQGQGDSMARL
jgi:ankyrin repeat protein